MPNKKKDTKNDLFNGHDEPIVAVDTDAAEDAYSQVVPLAVAVRPSSLDEFIGQEHVLAEGKLLRRTIMADRLQSAIFFGPPGTGKTTLGFIVANLTNARFELINAVSSNVTEMRKIIETARYHKESASGKRTILFVDEIHRFNKAQQDVLMPAVEQQDVILLGATTHNPTFSINGPLLSRSLLFEFRRLSDLDIVRIIKNAISNTAKGFGRIPITFEENALEHIASQSNGDARRALNALEIAVMTTPPDEHGTIHLSVSVAEESVQKKIVYYDKNEDFHYDTISAFIKSIRGSDPDAALYWLARMLHAGEDPLFIMRRMIILASEDIGNADPEALRIATSALQALDFIGMPEGRIVLAQTVTYLASAPKSNASYIGIEEALNDIEHEVVEEVPQHLRDKSYVGAKRLGRGEGYIYPHARKEGFVDQEYVSKNKKYYRPTTHGHEKIIKDRLERLEKFRKQKEVNHDNK